MQNTVANLGRLEMFLNTPYIDLDRNSIVLVGEEVVIVVYSGRHISKDQY